MKNILGNIFWFFRHPVLAAHWMLYHEPYSVGRGK
jgi:hypothetical protein